MAAFPSFHNPTTKYYHDFHQSASEYARRDRSDLGPKPEVCPFCKEPACCLVGWGSYPRWAIDADGQHRILIKLWKCRRRAVGGYISVQPTFLLPYRQYTFLVIYRILCLRLLLGLTLRDSWQRVMGDTRFAYQTVQYWVKALSARCGFWSGIMQGEIGLASVGDNASGSVQMLAIMEQYLGPDAVENARIARHGVLLHRYRGSPLCRRRYP